MHRIFAIPAISLMMLSSLPANAGNTLITTNPMNLNYRFQPEDQVRREAADPVCEWFKDAYYLFASKSGGYWRSTNLVDWQYIASSTIKTIDDYAPTIIAINDTLYYKASSTPRIFMNPTPEKDTWTEVANSQCPTGHDPAFFLDDDNRLYLYWGCSNVDPIMGVELDYHNSFRPIGEPKELISHNHDKYGWEQPGDTNQEDRPGWNEGPCMIKFNGKYYLQYAGPGTQYRVYADGIYVGDSPLGPFEYVRDNPFSLKPGGFIGGAGHGHSFFDRHGNLWHVASMRISARHSFERRLGLFPVVIKDNGNWEALTTWSDYPFYVPQEKYDFSTSATAPDWQLMSINCPVRVSSSIKDHEGSKAVDERVETWWAAATSDKDEWLEVNLEATRNITAVHVNFADHDATARPPHTTIYRYVIEISDDGNNWDIIHDNSNNTSDEPHKLIVFDRPVSTRYVRIRNTEPVDGKFSLFDLRIFGESTGDKPLKINSFVATRDSNDKRRFQFLWSPVNNADGYVIRWGIDPDDLSHSVTIPGQNVTKYEAGFFNSDDEYHFTISAYNKAGEGDAAKNGEVSVPGTIEAENLDADDYKFSDTATAKNQHSYRSDVWVAITSHNNGMHIGNTTTGDYFNYTFNCAEEGEYKITTWTSSDRKNSKYSISIDGKVIDTAGYDETGWSNWDTYKPRDIAGVNLTSGMHKMTFTVVTGPLNVDKFEFSITDKSGITGITAPDRQNNTSVYTLGGQVIHKSVPIQNALDGLSPGIYIVGDKKIMK